MNNIIAELKEKIKALKAENSKLGDKLFDDLFGQLDRLIGFYTPENYEFKRKNAIDFILSQKSEDEKEYYMNIIEGFPERNNAEYNTYLLQWEENCKEIEDLQEKLFCLEYDYDYE